MSNYESVLEELKTKTHTSAKEYVPKLYQILRDEEGKSPLDAREIIIKDLKSYLSILTIREFIPDEAKNLKKQEAGRLGGKAKEENIASEVLDEGKSQGFITNDDNKPVEESPKIIIDTSGESVDDETDEQHDQRSEQSITDEVNKSMHQEARFPYSSVEEDVKKYNKIMMQQGEKIKELEEANAIAIEQFKAKLKAAEERTKDQEYIKLEEKLLKLEEINARLLNENKQYSEAVLKHSFESATNVKVDSQQIKNYESMIKSLEDIITTKNFQLNELTIKNESFAHIDTVGQPQPIELDVHKFVGIIFANRQNKVTLVHDNKKVLNITGGGG